jgi:membrane-bound ClpP family serine protease
MFIKDTMAGTVIEVSESDGKSIVSSTSNYVVVTAEEAAEYKEKQEKLAAKSAAYESRSEAKEAKAQEMVFNDIMKPVKAAFGPDSEIEQAPTK